MKKSLIALAVAGAIAAPMAAQADGHGVAVSGTVNLRLNLTNEKKSSFSAKKDSGTAVGSGDVQINFAASEDVGFGTAYGSVRLDLNSLSVGDGITDKSKGVERDNVQVGLKGAFGDVQLGDVNVASVYQAGELKSFVGGSNAGLAYNMPEVVPGLSAGILLVGTEYSDEGTTQTKKEATGLGAKYVLDLADAGKATFGFGTRNLKTTEKVFTNVTQAEITNKVAPKSESGGESSSSATLMAVGYSIMGVSIGVDIEKKASWSDKENATATKKTYKDGELTAFALGYTMGPISVGYKMNERKNLGSADNYMSLTDSTGIDKNDAATKDLKTTSTINRIDLTYTLAEKTKVYVRNQTQKDEITGGAKKIVTTDESVTYVELQKSF